MVKSLEFPPSLAECIQAYKQANEAFNLVSKEKQDVDTRHNHLLNRLNSTRQSMAAHPAMVSKQAAAPGIGIVVNLDDDNAVVILSGHVYNCKVQREENGL